jgi:Peptidase M50B-like
MAWTTGVVAFVAAVPLWRYTTHAITVAHEGGHMMFGSLLGLTLEKVRIDRGGVGSTKFTPDNTWLPWVAAGLAGYLGPSVFGLAGAVLLVHGVAPRAVLLMTLVLMAFLLLMVRNVFGFLVVPLTGLLIWAVATKATAEAQLVFAHIWVWFLLMGGVRQIPELYRAWAAGPEPDTAMLAGKTGLSTAFFVALFWLGSMAALVYGGVLLLRHAG